MIIDFVFLTLKCECQAADRVSSAVSVKHNSLWPSVFVCAYILESVCVFIFLMHVFLLAMQRKIVLKQCIVI